MDYKRVLAVWEITGICDMGCKHCGSSYKKALADELSTEEALKLCDELAKMGLERIVISGGEAIQRRDWKLIVNRLKDKGLTVGLLTNAWSLDNEMRVDEIIGAGVSRFGISLDGLEETHDFMRKEGSFQKIMRALDLLRERDKSVVIATTITKKNLNELEQMKVLLKENDVKEWQLQLGLPMGNFKSLDSLVIDPAQMKEVIDFANRVSKEEDNMIVYLGDCFGYYSFQRLEVDKINYKKLYNKDLEENNFLWRGCAAGRETFAILPNGDIMGCVTFREKNKEFIEGNIRKRPLKDILEDPDSFKWINKINKKDLKGLCAKCQYGDECLGGCPNPRVLIEGDVYSENKYCTYNVDMKEIEGKIDKVDDFEDLYMKGRILFEKGNFQVAEILLAKALRIDRNNMEALNLYSQTHFMLKNYSQAIEVSKLILEKDANNIEAHREIGLSLCKLKNEEEGIEFLKKSIELTDTDYMAPYHDLAETLVEYNKIKEAINVLVEGRNKSEEFKKESQELYEQLVG
ncbi:radical SAM protein with 4Fe4S-binding SPASM domain [Orenia metallireducens]|uniref:Radical SAM additional 4Fe4S-binding SPASM domain-containing protein n=1 Tax=Orenia metallireducens TaxID=1413210 RepID=A0A285IFW6_9FIRM|nr:radical SAM protein [Orenia metallireducens]PRX18132.1 radical SAM protein with 4Fe4S-binding SPASM domain [Orenia metallireducens]SNY46890.1 radical SAM additional 4Fe4S-binding SPASM domain-containing protein [Orenia metallireducens]